MENAVQCCDPILIGLTEQSIRFIDHEKLKMREIEGRCGSDMIEQPSGSAHNDVHQTGAVERRKVKCGKRGRKTSEKVRGKRG